MRDVGFEITARNLDEIDHQLVLRCIDRGAAIKAGYNAYKRRIEQLPKAPVLTSTEATKPAHIQKLL